MKPTIPMTKALNMLDRYHLLGSTVVCSSSWLSARSELAEDDMFKAKENWNNNAIERESMATYLLILMLYGNLLDYILYTKICRTIVVESIVPYCARLGIHFVTADNVRRAQAMLR
jgi:hypothetical protein